MRNVYLDYSATTPVKEEVLKEMLPYFTEKFGNPSSLYDTGLEAKAAVSANVNVTASYSFTDAKYTHDTWYEGRRPAEVPRNMASLWADYTFHETALSGLTVGAGTRYIGNTVSYYSASSPKAYQSFNVAGYALADATVKYDLARFGLPGSSVGVNVNNIFDREYVSSCYSEYACYWGAGRQVVATATFRF